MSGTSAGGKQAARTNRQKYGNDYYNRIGVMGGSKRVSKGFGKMDKAKSSKAGIKGGQTSRKPQGPLTEVESKRSNWYNKWRIK